MNELETLRAENEALKAENKRIRRLVIKTDDINVGLLMQRRMLVEALEAAERFISNGVEHGFIRMPDPETPDTAHKTLPLIQQTLSTIPAEALEAHRLSEVLNKASVEYHDALHSKTQHSLNLTKEAKLAYVNDFRKAVNDFEAHRKGVKDGQVYTAYFEVHREKVKK